MSRIAAAFRCFFSILFSGSIPDDVAGQFGLAKPASVEPPKPPEPKILLSDGALLLLHILQRDSRLLDFLMEDITGYSDDQVGAAVRTVHSDGRASLMGVATLAPVIDGVEGTQQTFDASKAPDPNRIKLIGNVPASGKVSAGVLRHRGWMATAINLPALGKQDLNVVAPAEIEVE